VLCLSFLFKKTVTESNAASRGTTIRVVDPACRIVDGERIAFIDYGYT